MLYRKVNLFLFPFVQLLMWKLKESSNYCGFTWGIVIQWPCRYLNQKCSREWRNRRIIYVNTAGTNGTKLIRSFAKKQNKTKKNRIFSCAAESLKFRWREDASPVCSAWPDALMNVSTFFQKFTAIPIPQILGRGRGLASKSSDPANPKAFSRWMYAIWEGGS